MINKLEIDVMQNNELYPASEFAHKHKFQSLIVHQELYSEAQLIRGRIGGKYNLIIPIDWPKGETYGSQKMRGLSVESLDADGFEIFITGGKNMTDTRKELHILTDFIKTHLGKNIEVRFVIGASARSEEEITNICTALLDIPKPACIRTDIQLKTQTTKANIETHLNIIQLINKTIRIPIKISGNITLKTLKLCEAFRYAVNLVQAKNIITEHYKK